MVPEKGQKISIALTEMLTISPEPGEQSTYISEQLHP